jgi:hypothetical protein
VIDEGPVGCQSAGGVGEELLVGTGGEVWVGYQTAAAIVFAALLVAAEPVRTASD